VDRGVLMAIVVAFMLVLLGLLALGWYARRRRQVAIAAPASVPSDPGSFVGQFAGKYVATTVSGDPFDRIAVHGLGFRGSVEVTVTVAGLVVRIVGENGIWIPREALRGIRRATWTIDRAVETNGLHLIEWSLGDSVVDSYFRMDDPAAFGTAVDSIIERQTA
jgi:hypothetical protein